jgi:hypothetical protein
MRRTEAQVKYDKVRSSEDQFQEHEDNEESYDHEGYHDELGDSHHQDGDDANSLLAPSSLMEPNDEDGFDMRGGGG